MNVSVVDLLRAPFILGVPLVILFDPGSNGAFVGAAAALMLALRFAPLPPALDAAFVLALALAAWGNPLDLYEWSRWFGLGVHVLMSSLDGPVLFVALTRLGLLPVAGRQHAAGVFVVVLALAVAVGAWWEVIEWTIDSLFGTELVDQQALVADLVADTVGGFVGAAATARFRFGTSSSTSSG